MQRSLQDDIVLLLQGLNLLCHAVGIFAVVDTADSNNCKDSYRMTNKNGDNNDDEKDYLKSGNNITPYSMEFYRFLVVFPGSNPVSGYTEN
jgi:hypothetical protein